MVNILIASALILAAEFLMSFVLMLIILSVNQLAGLVYAGCIVVKFISNMIVKVQIQKLKGDNNG